jgi:hypothetical protein
MKGAKQVVRQMNMILRVSGLVHSDGAGGVKLHRT